LEVDVLKKTFLVVVAGLAVLALAAGCGDQVTDQQDTEQSAPAEQETAVPEQSTAANTTADVTELVIEDIVVGTGAEAKSGDTVTVHYTGWLTDGTKFDSSVDAGQPLQFPLGQGYVIQGWDEGVAGMKVGGKRKLIIPPDMGYGAQGAGGVIPPNATLVFEVELVSIP
jgi:FKBP-type peptidyl-prolyl cis-trans isomerase